MGDGGYTKNLLKISEGYPVEIVKNPDFSSLKDIYGKARIFWSASGFDEDEDKNPEKVEHFGITVVEAMAGGAIPVVYNAGGHKEIIDDGRNGFLWETAGDLRKITKKLIDDASEARKISLAAKEGAEKFRLERFRNEILSYILQP